MHTNTNHTPPGAAEQLPDDLVSVKKAARLARCHIAAVYRWVFKGKLAGWKRAQGRLFVSRAQVLGLFEKVPTSPAEQQTPVQLERRRRVDAILREAKVG